MARKTGNKNYSANLTFEEFEFSPFHGVFVIGCDNVHGRLGLSKSLENKVPNGFKMIKIADEQVDVVFINFKVLVKLTEESVIKLLTKSVFPFISPGEILKVHFDLKINLTKSR